MGKRSDFERNPRDFYVTPEAAVLPLLPHLDPKTKFIEPCAGNGALIDILEKYGHTCTLALDIKPERKGIFWGDATTHDFKIGPNELFITNPPWSRDALHDIIINLCFQAPTWLLFDADWAYTVQSKEYMIYCRKIVAVSRAKWFADTSMTGKDNAAWYLFNKDAIYHETLFYGR